MTRKKLRHFVQTPSPAPPHQCNNGPILCCKFFLLASLITDLSPSGDQVQDASSATGLLGTILGLLGIVLSDIVGLV